MAFLIHNVHRPYNSVMSVLQQCRAVGTIVPHCDDVTHARVHISDITP